MMKNKKGQEEMVGFAIIIILVAVILLVFLGISLRNSKEDYTKSYEAQSFVQAVLQYNTDCAKTYEPNYLSIQKLISECNDKKNCLDGRDSCEVLESTLEDILEKSWKIEQEGFIKGYELKIISDKTQEIIKIQKGNSTINYKGAVQDFSKNGKQIEILFNVYS